ncbi:MAG: hypothetical protein ACI9KN_002414 [Gammaproteobacteria bacterium]|jgi:hypothetical protein
MKSLIRLSIVVLSLVGVSACSGVSVHDYADNKPVMKVAEFFNGALSAHGMVKNRSGKVTRYFNASINAYWEDGVGTLDEVFTFDDGEQQRRIWKLVKDESGNYTGSANDVVGTTTLKVAGNSLFLDYILRIPYGEDSLDLHIDDRMYLISDRVLLNESVMSKWGFEVGQVTLVIEKLDTP